MDPKNNKKITTNPFHNGHEDNLQPLEPLDLSQLHTVADLVAGMKNTSFGARSLGEAADVFYEMVTDEDTFVVLTLSGAMTIAKMGLVVCEMVDRGMVQSIVSTGALIAHELIESVGMTHFKYDSKMDDKTLYDAGYNRVYDTLELERNFTEANLLFNKVFDTVDVDEVLCSYKINHKIGCRLHEKYEGRGILKSAYEKGVPCYIPAFTDSELGLEFALLNRWRAAQNQPQLRFDPFLDLNHYTEEVFKAKRLGIFTVGGGVPRNWAQQVGPYLELAYLQFVVGDRTAETRPEEPSPYSKKFHYAVRICPEPAHWGGLSGCTYSEGVSWGKFVPQEHGGRQVEVFADATIAWPFVIKAILERLK